MCKETLSFASRRVRQIIALLLWFPRRLGWQCDIFILVGWPYIFVPVPRHPIFSTEWLHKHTSTCQCPSSSIWWIRRLHRLPLIPQFLCEEINRFVEAFFSTNQHVGGRMILRCLMFFREHVSFSSAFPQKTNMLTCYFSMANLRFFGFDQLASFPIMMWRTWWRLLPKRNGWEGVRDIGIIWLMYIYICIFRYIYLDMRHILLYKS